MAGGAMRGELLEGDQDGPVWLGFGAVAGRLTDRQLCP